jgi:hypothetical protein
MLKINIINVVMLVVIMVKFIVAKPTMAQLQFSTLGSPRRG